VVWAEPVTGSSGTPCAGAKKRETKSMPSSPGAVTIAAQQSTCASAAKSGFSAAISAAAAVDDEMIASAQRFARRAAQSGEQARRCFARRRWPRGKIHRQHARPTAHDKRTGLERAKAHALALRLETAEHDMRRSQRRMPAEIDLDTGREPAQRILVTLAATACMVALGSQVSSGQIAAGLPPNNLSVKAST